MATTTRDEMIDYIKTYYERNNYVIPDNLDSLSYFFQKY